MPTGVKQPGDVPNAHRREDGRVLNTTIDMEAFCLLEQWATSPGHKGIGKVIARLAYEERVRREERAAMQERLRTALGETA